MINNDLPVVAPISSDAICTKWPTYTSLVRDRLLVGARQYGDESFSRPVTQLLHEISQELLDISGWAFVCWVRLENLMRKIEEEADDSK